jgi:hypothetical protein
MLVPSSSHEAGEGRTETLYADPQAEMDPEALALPLFPKLSDQGETRNPSHLFSPSPAKSAPTDMIYMYMYSLNAGKNCSLQLGLSHTPRNHARSLTVHPCGWMQVSFAMPCCACAVEEAGWRGSTRKTRTREICKWMKEGRLQWEACLVFSCGPCLRH